MILCFHPSVFTDPVLPPILQGEKPRIPSGPSPSASWSHSLSAFGHILVSQRHSPSWCPTTRFILRAPCRRLFSILGGTLPDMLWLLAPSVLFHPGECQSFLFIYHQMFRYPIPCYLRDKMKRHLTPPQVD